jgi:antitoxin HicB
MNAKHLGGDFDEFLDEEGLLEEAEAVATKRVLAFQIAQAMKEQNHSAFPLSRQSASSIALRDPSRSAG